MFPVTIKSEMCRNEFELQQFHLSEFKLLIFHCSELVENELQQSYFILMSHLYPITLISLWGKDETVS